MTRSRGLVFSHGQIIAGMLASGRMADSMGMEGTSRKMVARYLRFGHKVNGGRWLQRANLRSQDQEKSDFEFGEWMYSML
mmetsp:Transcript_57012/g.90329  ORF Transcript_57012/g.90329 Transcript_57012/m.90329 type:complete len:80 (+) Transcript_57012:558-797(+)